MMSIDLPDQAPPLSRAPQNLPRRPTPCAGLFGWRKNGDDKRGEPPKREHPLA